VANADLVAEVSPFWYRATTASQVAQQDGNDLPESDLTAAVQQLHDAGVAVYPTINDEGFDATSMARLLGDPDRRRELIDQILLMVQRTGADGVDLDFEAMNFGDVGRDRTAVKELYPVLLERLQARLAEQGAVLSVDVPARRSASDPNWEVFDYDAIGQVVDRVRVMTYDYSVSVPGPIAPIDWVREVTRYAATEFRRVPLSVGVPAYGQDWYLKTLSGTCPSGVGATGRESQTSEEALALVESHDVELEWSATAEEYHFDYRGTYEGAGTSCVVLRRVWFGEGRSAQARLELARRLGVQGIAVWRFGDEDPKLWTRARSVAAQISPDAARTTVTAPAALDAGAALALSARFTVSGTPVVAGDVVVQSRVPGRDWRTVADYVTGEDGRIEHVTSATRTLDWRVRLASAWDWSTTVTRVARVTVRHAVDAALVDAVVAAGQRYSITGEVRPAAQTPIRVQRRSSGSWITVKSAVTAADGTYTTSGTFSVPGVYRLRVVAPSDAQHATGTSPELTLTVE
jgi:spore germination protein YaaH/5-hydroxyisourate hydrolase-like protein (transthyretin family)